MSTYRASFVPGKHICSGVMKVIWRCYESVMEPFCPFWKILGVIESHMKVLRKCYRNHSYQLAPNARIFLVFFRGRMFLCCATSSFGCKFIPIPIAFRGRVDQRYAFGLSERWSRTSWRTDWASHKNAANQLLQQFTDSTYGKMVFCGENWMDNAPHLRRTRPSHDRGQSILRMSTLLITEDALTALEDTSSSSSDNLS